MDLSGSQRKIEDLPSDGGKIVDVLAGGLLRVFARLNQLDQAVARLGRRIAVLQGPQAGPGPVPKKHSTHLNGASGGTGIRPFGGREDLPAQGARGRGRPQGAKDSYRRVRSRRHNLQADVSSHILDRDWDTSG
jgi:hypothetical protein